MGRHYLRTDKDRLGQQEGRGPGRAAGSSETPNEIAVFRIEETAMWPISTVHFNTTLYFVLSG